VVVVWCALGVFEDGCHGRSGGSVVRAREHSSLGVALQLANFDTVLDCVFRYRMKWVRHL